MNKTRKSTLPGARLLLASALTVLALGLGASPAQARTKMYMGVKIKPLLDIKVGDKGYCKTVFQGLTVSTFRFHVKGILFNYFPRQHLILIASDDPKLKRAGVVAGMSGSPCYIDGGVAGALAYGPNWSKRAIAMLTPIKYMLDELKRKPRNMRRTPILTARRQARRPRLAATLGLGKAKRPTRSGVALARRLLSWKNPRNPLSPWFRAIPAPLSAKLRTGVAGMRRLSVPLAVSGFDRMTLKELKKDLAPYGLRVVQGGGSSADALKYYKPPGKFVNGGSIGVQLVRGALSMNGTGTVTVVKGNKVLAFGHPMANWGQHYIPVTSAWIHMFMPSYGSSYKISTALGELGRLVQDRRPCIIAEVGKKAPMIPVKVTLQTKARGKKDYSFEIFSNRIVTHYYINYALRTLIRRELPDVTDTTISASFSFDISYRDRKARKTVQKTVTLDDYFNAGRGAVYGFKITQTRGFRIMSYLLATSLNKIYIKKVRVKVKAEYKTKAVDIEDVRLTSNHVAPGELAELRIKLRRRQGRGSYVKTVQVPMPRGVPFGSLIRLDISSGTYASVDMAPPESIADVLRIVKRMYHARQLVVRVMQPGEGTSVNGRLITNLPGSVLDSLRSGSSAKQRIGNRTSYRKVLTLSDVIMGKKQIYVRISRPGR